MHCKRSVYNTITNILDDYAANLPVGSDWQRSTPMNQLAALGITGRDAWTLQNPSRIDVTYVPPRQVGTAAWPAGERVSCKMTGGGGRLFFMSFIKDLPGLTRHTFLAPF